MTAVPHVIILMTDQHARHAAGAYGNVTVQTPHLDAFAARGTAFDNAYCASPMCVPSRAALMTGRPVHETRSWDNAHPYTGVPEGWAHVVRSAGMRTAVIGKMHFRSPDDDTGFDEVILPLDVSDGIGDVYSLVRDDMPARPALAALVRQAGVGTSPYLDYDRAVADAACRWLDAAPEGEPWALLVSFATPHHPLVVPQEYWDLYPEVDVSTALVAGDDEPAHQHPYPAELRRVMGVESAFTVEEVTRARRAYYGLCTLADRLVGQVLDHATSLGFDDSSTVVVYTSDHGVSLGERGLWWKHHLYEESVGVPLLVTGPGFAPGARVEHPVSLTSIYPTVLAALGVPDDRPGSGRSPALSPHQEPHFGGGFAEYHGLGASSGAFMLRHGRYKLVHYTTAPPQLFDLENDPGEQADLAGEPEYATVLAQLTAALRNELDPKAVDARARSDQARLVDRHGGRQAVLSAGFRIPYTAPPSDDR